MSCWSWPSTCKPFVSAQYVLAVLLEDICGLRQTFWGCRRVCSGKEPVSSSKGIYRTMSIKSVRSVTRLQKMCLHCSIFLSRLSYSRSESVLVVQRFGDRTDGANMRRVSSRPRDIPWTQVRHSLLQQQCLSVGQLHAHVLFTSKM